MGARLLRGWMIRPSIDAAEIEARYDAVAELSESVGRGRANRQFFRRNLRSGTAVYRASRSEPPARGNLLRCEARSGGCRQSRDSAETEGRTVCGSCILVWILLEDLHALLSRAVSDNPPPALADGGVIREGYDTELDELRSLSKNNKGYLAMLESRERERTGINSLKVRFNNVFGYYIEISNANLHLVPKDYDRKQTLVNAERFSTPELKEYEEKILTAEERILEIEKQLFQEIRNRIAGGSSPHPGERCGDCRTGRPGKLCERSPGTTDIRGLKSLQATNSRFTRAAIRSSKRLRSSTAPTGSFRTIST